jgi:hypothetical protein
MEQSLRTKPVNFHLLWGGRFQPKYKSENASLESKVWENELMSWKDIIKNAAFWNIVSICPETHQKQSLILHMKVKFASAKDPIWFSSSFFCRLWDTFNIKWQSRITVQPLESCQFIILGAMWNAINTTERDGRSFFKQLLYEGSKLGRPQSRQKRNALRGYWIPASNDKTLLRVARKRLLLCCNRFYVASNQKWSDSLTTKPMKITWFLNNCFQIGSECINDKWNSDQRTI